MGLAARKVSQFEQDLDKKIIILIHMSVTKSRSKSVDEKKIKNNESQLYPNVQGRAHTLMEMTIQWSVEMTLALDFYNVEL